MQAIEIKLDDVPEPQREFGRVKDYKEARAAAEKAVKARNARVSQAIQGALAADAAMIRRRALLNMKALGKDESKEQGER